jgi:hypothetical protein
MKCKIKVTMRFLFAALALLMVVCVVAEPSIPGILLRRDLEEYICGNHTYVQQQFHGNFDRCFTAVNFMVTLADETTPAAIKSSKSIVNHPNGCGIMDGLTCAGTVASCVPTCVAKNWNGCVACFGGVWGKCCPCLQTVIRWPKSC